MTRVQYVRPYSPDELADVGTRLETLFKDEPSVVALAVLAMELKNLLEPTPNEPTPPPAIAALRTALADAAPMLVGFCIRGLARDEFVS